MQATDHSRQVALSVRGLTRHFGPVRALNDVTLDVYDGTLTAVMGENGAGKSTFMKILAGLDSPTAGDVEVRGTPVTRFDPSVMLSEHRVALVPQELALAGERTVAQNIMLGAEPGSRFFPSGRAVDARAAELLDRLGERLDPRRPVRELDAATQQIVVIARALAREARVVIFDEPTAVLSPAESERLFAVIEGLRADGVTMLYVSHRIPEVFALSDRIHVLRDGHHIGGWDTSEVTPDQVVGSMVGRDLSSELARSETTSHRESGQVPRLALREVRAPRVHDVSLDVAPGEVLGIAGLPDSGRVELLRAVFGADPTDGGKISLDGETVRHRSPRDAIANGIAYLPGERRHQGIFPTMSVADNMNVLTLSRRSQLGLLRRGALRADAKQRAEQLRVKISNVGQGITQLSGGNQQKALIARWLAIDPRLMLLDEPTRGVDVGAKAEIYAVFRELTTSGMAMVVSSSDLPELLAITDRIAVMAAGHVVGVLPTATATEESIMALATGADTLKESA
ncbi:monosaccharide ABC transporter ATP-binding protein, CUT2 family [Georgenia satyanarayanai]|uniref:Monosaccharide ABC transporter ATP-binding protein, CUT2 family n=1 Tax=Georgenia satyanarayanai TaxID=860221 RepID=A0A2Y9BZY7_9MICO|nr:sugar ABC transporter ATP-binding protein [Georgenia satyanarayanai]PYF98317.1 monosaccharide ABC transporter ATP-binding protein (CUT2 family) [Georgenia satyanarayanai]SSA45202.1 monosaccharide ABC transporter ATP-binding protein, CUT2 family [Georgenia satyanarayanai]